MKTKHTPSPWFAQSNGEILTEEGVIIAQAYDNPGEDESEYNNVLIASAPDLLAACETEEAMLSNLLGDIAAGRALNGERMKEGLTLRRDALRAAIARANP